MRTHSSNLGVWVSIALAGLTHAHMAPFHSSMYCLKGNVRGVDNLNSNAAVKPLYNLAYNEFWMHHENNCDQFPPEPDAFLELYPGKSFTVELAENRAYTSLNPHAKLTDWGDGMHHPDNYGLGNLGGKPPTDSNCISSPNLHTQNQSMAAGTAFAISYESDLAKVKPDNLVVFTVRHNTPWKRVTNYDVPVGLPPCDDCTCVFGWVPNGCGQPNMYMLPYRCKVISNAASAKHIGVPKPARWCEGEPDQCTAGAKQILIWNQAESNNIAVKGNDLSGHPKSPAYNTKCGFKDGAQDDIFVDAAGQAIDASGHSKRMIRRAKGGFF